MSMICEYCGKEIEMYHMGINVMLKDGRHILYRDTDTEEKQMLADEDARQKFGNNLLQMQDVEYCNLCLKDEYEYHYTEFEEIG